MLNWAAVECCWKICVPGPTRASVNNEHFSLLWICRPFTNCVFRLNALHAGGPLPSSPTPSCGMWVASGSGVRSFVVLGCLWNEGQVVIGQTTSIVTNRLKGGGSRKCLRLLERHVSLLQAMDEILYGTLWRMISPLLTTNDAVRCRTVTSRWNVGSRYGEMDEFFSC